MQLELELSISESRALEGDQLLLSKLKWNNRGKEKCQVNLQNKCASVTLPLELNEASTVLKKLLYTAVGYSDEIENVNKNYKRETYKQVWFDFESSSAWFHVFKLLNLSGKLLIKH